MQSTQISIYYLILLTWSIKIVKIIQDIIRFKEKSSI